MVLGPQELGVKVEQEQWRESLNKSQLHPPLFLLSCETGQRLIPSTTGGIQIFGL